MLARCALLALAESSLCALALLTPVTLHGETALPSCRKEGEMLEVTRVPGKRRVAILMRGEAFRTGRKAFTPEQYAEADAQGSHHEMYGYLRRLSCGPESYQRQEAFASNVLAAMDYAESKGVQVDLFGTTFPCPNNETYHTNLSSIFGDIFKGLRILGADAFKTSTQITSVRDVFHQALQHMKEKGMFYDQVYVIRWDAPYYCKHFRFEDVHKFPQDQGPFSPAFNVGNPDQFYLIPGRYMPCFHEFVFNASEWARERLPDGAPGECCRAQTSSTGKACGGGGDCNACISNFWKKCCPDLDQSRSVSSWKSSCEGDPDKVFVDRKPYRDLGLPSAPSWLPSSDVGCDTA